MRMQIKTGIGVALLAGSILMTVHAQTANVSSKKNGNNQSAGNSQPMARMDKGSLDRLCTRTTTRCRRQA